MAFVVSVPWEMVKGLVLTDTESGGGIIPSSGVYVNLFLLKS